MNKIKILVVEDELITATHIATVLKEKGYDVPPPIVKGEDVPAIAAIEKPNVIIMDINLAGKLNGIETAKIITSTSNTPIIFLTANADDATFEKSKSALPYAFISKPFKAEELLRTVEVIINLPIAQFPPQDLSAKPSRNEKSIFVTSRNKKVKIDTDKILYILADRNYCTVVTNSKEYVLSMSLGVFEKKVHLDTLIRVHRSYLVNLTAVDSLDEHYVFIGQKSIPIGKSYKNLLRTKIKIL
ncbi:MAG: response regulator [Saprospiraceae bacterium]